MRNAMVAGTHDAQGAVQEERDDASRQNGVAFGSAAVLAEALSTIQEGVLEVLVRRIAFDLLGTASGERFGSARRARPRHAAAQVLVRVGAARVAKERQGRVDNVS